MWQSNIGSIVKDDIGEEAWIKFQTKADQRYGFAGKLRKNSLHIGATLAFAWEAGKQSDNLERLCNGIVSLDNSLPS